MSTTNPNTFRIGISMAGAISAGAYTAGTIDYLLEALEHWQKAKELNIPGTPRHNVVIEVIEVIDGASAGGMTAVMTAAALQKTFPHINQGNYNSTETANNPLFDSWVNLTETPGNDMMSQMLNTDDILNERDSNPDKEVRSVFNSLFIEKIARRTIGSIIADPATKREYIAGDMELFTTITNLRGFDYDLQFITAAGIREDRMTMHKDIVHFQLKPNGRYDNDGRIPFNFGTAEGLNKDLLIDAAIATGAFPVGLAPRVVVRDAKYINDNPLLKITNSKKEIVNPLTEYNTVCVDGGVINNEPYDLTETILARRANVKEDDVQTDASRFDSTTLMVDPFPSYGDKPVENYFDLVALMFAVPQLLTAMRQQLMIKTGLLEKAYSEVDYSKFMIAPIRTKNGITQKFSIACGSLGGFGGFFEKRFRVHDYMLGRRNCQRFLQQYFTVPVSAHNPIIEAGYGGLSDEERKFFADICPDKLPIIPDIRIDDGGHKIVRPAEEGEFDYPSISLKYLLGLEKKIQNRMEVVLDNITNGKDPSKAITPENKVVQRIRKKSWFGRNITGPIGGLAAKLYLNMGKSAGKDIIAEKFVDAIITDMDKRGLLKEDC